MDYKENIETLLEELSSEVDKVLDNEHISEEEYAKQAKKIYKKQEKILEKADKLIEKYEEIEKEIDYDSEIQNKENVEIPEEVQISGNINNKNKNRLNKKKGIILLILFLVVSVGIIKGYKILTTKPEKEVKEILNLADPNTLNIVDIKTEDDDISIDLKGKQTKNIEINSINNNEQANSEYDKLDRIQKIESNNLNSVNQVDESVQRDRKEIEDALADIEGTTREEIQQKRDRKNNIVNSMTFFKKDNSKLFKDEEVNEDSFNNIFKKANMLNNKNSSTIAEGQIQNRVLNSSLYSVLQGSVIPAILITEINTDIPGDIIAQVREDIYDTRSGKYLLIPKGSKIYGRYNAAIVNGQDRVMIAFDKLILPNGQFVNLTEMPGADNLGRSGVNDKVNKHTGSLIGNAVLASILNFGNTMAKSISFSVGGKILGLNGKENKNNENTSPFEKATGKILERAVDRKPTLTIRQGFVFNVIVNGEIVMTPYKY